MLNTLKKALATALYLWSAFREFRKEIALMAVLGFASGIFGGIGISIIIPLFTLIKLHRALTSLHNQFILSFKLFTSLPQYHHSSYSWSYYSP